jgi:hypothetical protein
MSSLVIGHLDLPGTPRYARAYEVAGERAGDVLAGRTVWCATALPRARRAAEQLRDYLEGAAPDGADCVRRFTPGVDAYLITWRERGPHGESFAAR